MSDVGITESVKDAPCKFELWFRRRTSGARYVLEAGSNCVRDLWLADVKTLLWTQALNSKEQRESEMANMGQRASCVDLQNSDESILDRSVSQLLLRDKNLPRLRASMSNIMMPNGSNTMNERKHSTPILNSHKEKQPIVTNVQCKITDATNVTTKTNTPPVDNRRPHSLISIGTSSSCSTNSTNGSRNAQTSEVTKQQPRQITCNGAGQKRHANGNSVLSFESGICVETQLAVLHENPAEGEYSEPTNTDTHTTYSKDLSSKLQSILNDENSVSV